MYGSSSSPPRSGQGSSSPPPSSRGHGFGSSSSPAPSSGSARDGRTPQTALWSSALERDPMAASQYLVRDILRSAWVRTTLTEAREYATDGLTVYHPDSLLPVTDWKVPLPVHNAEGAFAGQIATVSSVDQAVYEQLEGPYLEKESEKGTPEKATPKKGGNLGGKKDGSPGGNPRSPGAGGAGADVAA
ncbi:hypothetical protein P154DRAFT_558908, partial [Amniculicola lignicola CBS 123094]